MRSYTVGRAHADGEDNGNVPGSAMITVLGE